MRIEFSCNIFFADRRRMIYSYGILQWDEKYISFFTTTVFKSRNAAMRASIQSFNFIFYSSPRQMRTLHCIKLSCKLGCKCKRKSQSILLIAPHPFQLELPYAIYNHHHHPHWSTAYLWNMYATLLDFKKRTGFFLAFINTTSQQCNILLLLLYLVLWCSKTTCPYYKALSWSWWSS